MRMDEILNNYIHLTIMSTCIFIKTCSKDHAWLQFLLPSIEKYAEGFRYVLIISDTGTPIPQEYLNSLKRIPVHIRYIPVPHIHDMYIEGGVGYLWQQNVKLHWTEFCDTDSVLMLDSDQMLCSRTVPEDFKHEGKWIWSYRSWESAGGAICWKESNDKVLMQNTPYEAMCIPGFVLTRNATKNCVNTICQKHGVSQLWDLVTQKRFNKLSEYNIYGSFIESVQDPEYFYNTKLDIPIRNWDRIITFWSWGGITQGVRDRAALFI